MNYRRKRSLITSDNRMFVIKIGFVLFALAIISRLFILQIWQGARYSTLAENKHILKKELLPERGRIFFQNDKKTGELAPLALNKDTFIVVADPKIINDPKADVSPSHAARILAKKLDIDEMQVAFKLKNSGSRYEIIKKQVDLAAVEELKLEKLAGIYFERQPARFYPEKEMASQVVGFSGLSDDGKPVGHYGLEGYFNDLLSGKPGYMLGESDATGGWLPLAGREVEEATNGADLVLTIDKTIEYIACQKLSEGIAEYKAKGGTVIILNPKTGAILAMCDSPGFDPNSYQKTKNISVFNNSAIFTAYEPGSVFKAITMAGALDAGAVTPDTIYFDKGFIQLGSQIIKNAANKSYGNQTMTGVLKESINTGAYFAAHAIGHKDFKNYTRDFGFGVTTGVELDTEVTGNISSLEKEKEIYLATASFGQGITATPMQLVSAFGAIANQGKLFQPYIVSEIKQPDGVVEKKNPKLVRQVISARAARLLSGMLTTVVRDGHGKQAGVAGYYIGGKTGTAQIAGPNGEYLDGSTNQTFIGFGPVDDPAFVMLVKYEEPERMYAEYTAVPIFGKIAKFLLQYLEIPPNK
ncbi:MAG: penicillin-binding protein 2 [Candidatus Magasanikbacteria bacterium]|nr:penicillin-binding protein 2 [Candidatus Magasanikbacteria bacterium]